MSQEIIRKFINNTYKYLKIIIGRSLSISYKKYGDIILIQEEIQQIFAIIIQHILLIDLTFINEFFI